MVYEGRVFFSSLICSQLCFEVTRVQRSFPIKTLSEYKFGHLGVKVGQAIWFLFAS